MPSLMNTYETIASTQLYATRLDTITMCLGMGVRTSWKIGLSCTTSNIQGMWITHWAGEVVAMENMHGLS